MHDESQPISAGVPPYESVYVTVQPPLITVTEAILIKHQQDNTQQGCFDNKAPMIFPFPCFLFF
jgi:hypothetical protein